MARTDGLAPTLLVVALLGAVAIAAIRFSRRTGEPANPAISSAASARSRASAGPAPAVPLTAEDAASREAFRVNEGLPSDPALAAEFDEINARYLDGRVPPVTVRWEGRLTGMGGTIASGFRLEGLTDGYTILLNPDVRDDEALRRRTLTHEMVHVLLRNQQAGHGPVFQAALRQVATRAPYMGLIASDEEKATLYEQLRGQAEVLDREEKALIAERAALEAADPRTPGLQQRIDAFNERVAGQHAAADKYNGMVGVYNMMTAYPDGLDRERLATRRQ